MRISDWSSDVCSSDLVFIPLKLMLPDADIPVAQLSLLDTLDPVAHLAAGRALTPLRDDGVLIVGSGMSFHNMQAYGDPRFGPVSDPFVAWPRASFAAPPAERHPRLASCASATAAPPQQRT